MATVWLIIMLTTMRGQALESIPMPNLEICNKAANDVVSRFGPEITGAGDIQATCILGG